MALQMSPWLGPMLEPTFHGSAMIPKPFKKSSKRLLMMPAKRSWYLLLDRLSFRPPLALIHLLPPISWLILCSEIISTAWTSIGKTTLQWKQALEKNGS
jgi:hypothetical protein